MFSISFSDIDLKNFSIVMNLCILIANFIVVFFLNFFVFYRRRKNERMFQSNYDFYQKLVINKIDELFQFFVGMETILKDASINCKEFSDDETRRYIENGCHKIDDIFESFKRETIPIIGFYSNDLLQIINREFDVFYNLSVACYADIPSLKVRQNWQELTLNKFASHKNDFLEKIFESIKENKPKTD